MASIQLTFYGHACFSFETAGYRLVLDPYAPGSVPGYPPLALEAHEVLISHGHHDHNYIEGVRLLPEMPSPFSICTFASFHDDAGGSLRGENRIHLIEAEGVRVVHLGDLGGMPEAATLQALSGCDALLFPVGGYYTIDAAMAKAVTDAIDPAVVIPMHYRFAGHGPEVIGPVDDFLALDWDRPIHRLEGASFTVTHPAERQLAVLHPANR